MLYPEVVVASPVVHSADSYPLIVHETPCCQKETKCCEKRTQVASSDLPVSLTTAIQATMAMMAGIIAICGYQACSTGKFECTLKSFPDISHVMGGPPLNKLYSIMFAIYSCTKQAEARAYHDRLSTFVSPLVNALLLVASLASFIGGPCIGYWDCYYDIKTHCFVTTVFTVGEIVYIYGVVYLLHTNRSQFNASAGAVIDRCVFALIIVAIDGVLMNLGPDVLGISIHQIGEWIAFYSDFYVRW